MNVLVRALGPEDLPGAIALQRACFPPPFPEDHLWREEHLRAHLATFPEGQFVAIADGRVVGSASAAVVSEATWCARLGWEATLGGWELSGHDPAGTTLYGADISVHPEWRRRGVGRALYEARFDLVRRLGLTRYGTACRLPGYAASTLPTPEEYACAVAEGRLTDRTLSPLLGFGLRLVGVIEAYMPDEESGDAAARLEWTP